MQVEAGDAGKGEKRLAPEGGRHRALGASSQADDDERPIAVVGGAIAVAVVVAVAVAFAAGGARSGILFLP